MAAGATETVAANDSGVSSDSAHFAQGDKLKASGALGEHALPTTRQHCR